LNTYDYISYEWCNSNSDLTAVSLDKNSPGKVLWKESLHKPANNLNQKNILDSFRIQS